MMWGKCWIGREKNGWCRIYSYCSRLLFLYPTLSPRPCSLGTTFMVRAHRTARHASAKAPAMDERRVAGWCTWVSSGVNLFEPIEVLADGGPTSSRHNDSNRHPAPIDPLTLGLRSHGMAACADTPPLPLHSL